MSEHGSKKMTAGAGLFAAVLLVALFVVLTLFTAPALRRASIATRVANQNQAEGQAQSESVRRYEIHEDSGSTTVNAVQVRGTYPADKLDYVGVDSKDSPFSVSAEAKGGEGKFSIARGAITPVTGDHLVATLVFRLKNTTEAPELSLGADSALVASETVANLLSSGSARVYIKVVQ